jgi:hypothetical protein
MDGGIHIRAALFTAPDDDSVATLQIQVVPLPTALAQPLADFIRDAALAWLTQKQITSGQFTEIPLLPPGSKLN